MLWCETEDPLPEVVVPRLIAAGADRALVNIATREEFAALDLREYISRKGTRLLVMSPMISFLNLADINAELGVREVLERLQASIAGTGCSVVGIAHCNKKADLAAIERILGSVAFTNFVRSVLLITPESVEDRTHRLVHCKHNLSAKGDDLILRPVHVGEDYRDQFVKLEWSRPENGNVDAEAIFDRKKAANGKARQTAGNGCANTSRSTARPCREDVVIAGAQAGFKERTLEKAMTRDHRLCLAPRRLPWRRHGGAQIDASATVNRKGCVELHSSTSSTVPQPRSAPAGAHPMTAAPRQFSIVLRAGTDVADPLLELRALLKVALRRHGFRCLLLCPEPSRSLALISEPEAPGWVLSPI